MFVLRIFIISIATIGLIFLARMFFIQPKHSKNIVIIKGEDEFNVEEMLNAYKSNVVFSKIYDTFSLEEKDLFRKFCEERVKWFEFLRTNHVSKEEFIIRAKKIISDYETLSKKSGELGYYLGITGIAEERLNDGNVIDYPISVGYNYNSRGEFILGIMTDIFTSLLAKSSNEYLEKILHDKDAAEFYSKLSDKEQRHLYHFCTEVLALRDTVDAGEFNRFSYHDAVVNLLKPYKKLAKKFLSAGFDVFTLYMNLRYDPIELLVIGYVLTETGDIDIETKIKDLDLN